MTDPDNPAASVRLKGKYLETLEKFCKSLVLNADDFLIAPNAEYEELKESMAHVFHTHLTPEYVEAIIFRQVFECEVEWRGREGALSSPENEDVLASLIARLKTFFESIPRLCTLRIQLPQFTPVKTELQLAPDLKIVMGEAAPTNRLLAAALRGGAEVALLSPGVWLEIRTLGYGELSAKSPAPSTCLSIAKQCAFIMTSFGLCQTGFSPDRAQALFSDGERQDFYRLEIPESVSRLFSRLRITESELKIYDTTDSESLLGGHARAPANDEEMELALNSAFANVQRYFAARSNEDFVQIAAAIEWYQDSVWADNDTFAYIAACVGLEAILGSENEVLDSLTKRLADRYAFLMGAGRKEREKLRGDYTAVLKLRGRLVHGKAARLESKERHHLLKAQELLLNVIWKEVLRIRPNAFSGLSYLNLSE